jgi:histidine triad (HIT) family protein
MPSVFTRIINGELPGRFVWADDACVSFLSINPLQPGHALVVPRAEVDHWIDLDVTLAEHLLRVAKVIGEAQQATFHPARIGLLIAGFEVPHTHVHVIPVTGMRDLDFANAAADPDPAELDSAADRLRAGLRAQGRSEVPG